jgi:hypothetical protein
MKKNTKLFLIAALLYYSVPSFSGSIIQDPLLPGQCVAEPESKTYLNDPNKNQPVIFSCHYKCLNQEGKYSSIPVVHTETVLASADQMNVMVCDQIKIEVKKSSLGYILDQTISASSFWAQTSPRPELQKWANENNGRIPTNQYENLRLEMNKNLIQVASSIMPKDITTHSLMFSFATELIEIASSTEIGKQKEKYYIQLVQNKKDPETILERLVLSMLKTYGSFLFL